MNGIAPSALIICSLIAKPTSINPEGWFGGGIKGVTTDFIQVKHALAQQKSRNRDKMSVSELGADPIAEVLVPVVIGTRSPTLVWDKSNSLP